MLQGAGVDQKDARTPAFDGCRGLSVKSRKVVRLQGWGGRERLQQGEQVAELAVNVVSQGVRDLEQPGFKLLTFQVCGTDQEQDCKHRTGTRIAMPNASRCARSENAPLFGRLINARLTIPPTPVQPENKADEIEEIQEIRKQFAK